MVTVLLFVGLVVGGATVGTILGSAMSTFDRTPRSLRPAPHPAPPAGGRHRADP